MRLGSLNSDDEADERGIAPDTLARIAFSCVADNLCAFYHALPGLIALLTSEF